MPERQQEKLLANLDKVSFFLVNNIKCIAMFLEKDPQNINNLNNPECHLISNIHVQHFSHDT